MSLNKKPKLRYILKWTIWVLIVQFILGNISACIYAYKFTHFFKNPGEWNIAQPKNVFDKTWKLFKGPAFGKNENDPLPDFPFRNIQFTVANGKKIDVWHSAVADAKGTVCLFHGLSSSKAFYLPEARFFRDHGYSVLLLDFRGHGRSDGMKTSIGYNEAEEVKLAYNYLKSQGEHRIFLYGGSMGAVSIARAVAVHNLKPAGIILDMPFDGLVDHIKARGRSFGFPQTMFAIPVTSWIAIENSFPAFKHKTSVYAKKITCPVLLEWGTNDHLVTEIETTTIFNNLQSKKKKLVVYEDAVHSSLFRQDPIKWKTEIEQFLLTN